MAAATNLIPSEDEATAIQSLLVSTAGDQVVPEFIETFIPLLFSPTATRVLPSEDDATELHPGVLLRSLQYAPELVEV